MILTIELKLCGEITYRIEPKELCKPIKTGRIKRASINRTVVYVTGAASKVPRRLACDKLSPLSRA